jgi:hypothetical protein
MTDYRGNSHKSKGGGPDNPVEEKQIERITSAEVRIRKRGPMRTFKKLIIEADMGSVGHFVWLDIIVPMFKNMIVSTIEQGAHRAVYGDRYAAGLRPRPPSSAVGIGQTRGVINHVPYERAGLPMGRPDPRGVPQLQRGGLADPRGYLIVNREEAVRVLEQMAMVIDRYDVVSVADLHGMIGLTSSHIDNRWGWIDVRDAQIRGVRDGWLLELPEPEEIPV